MQNPIAHYFVFFLILAAIGWAVWRLGPESALFVVRIDRGEPHAVSGTVTPAFLSVLREVAAQHRIANARIRGVAAGKQVRLEFSRQFPPAACQQVRNWWGVSGWRSAPRRQR